MAKRNPTKHTKAGKQIISALTEIAEALESGVPLGERFTVREVTVPDPGAYDAHAIKALRLRLGISQRVFAYLMGVSVVLEQAWEQGRRFPSNTARRLLDEVQRDPKRWAGMLRPAKAA